MSLLKLVYIAHGWHLEITGEPLIENHIEAWQYGPVIPDVYRAFRTQGISVQNIDPNHPSDVSDDAKILLNQIYDIYGDMSPFKLSALTHVLGGPWETASTLGGAYAPIPDSLIRDHYALKRQTSNQANG